MLLCTLVLQQRNGFYIASHPWLRVSGFVKVGFSTRLETRLQMASFQTCFTPEWCYHTVFECKTAKEAHLLERSILYCLDRKRVPNRELIRSTEDEVVAVTRVIVEKLNISVVEKKRPNYAPQDMINRQQDGCETLLCPSAPAPTQDEGDNCNIALVHNPHPCELSIQPYICLLNDIKDQLSRVCPLSLQNTTTVLSELRHSHKFDADTSLLYDEWDEFTDSNKLPSFIGVEAETYTLKELRPYQVEAVERVKRELKVRGKTICQMACRCGKTPVAFQIMKEVLARKGATGSTRVLYLVPGLSLLRQTVKKLYHYGLKGMSLLLIGSDPNPILLEPGYSVSMTTNPELIQDAVCKNGPIVVFSTYHSSPLLEKLNIFDLTIFDECHRICGSLERKPFNTILQLPPSGDRLFLTATPTYDTPLRMNNEIFFGGIAYRYYLREGIDAGYVNPFSVRIILGTSLEDMNPYFFEAMRRVDKLLVFCRNIDHAEQLCNKLEAAMSVDKPTDPVKPFRALVAHSRMDGLSVINNLNAFTSSKRAILFNVRLFQEGVEIADLNAVFFAAPRYSSRDIIQSICRPLNKLPNKPNSYVFLPAVINSDYPADDPINLQNYSTLIPFTDALMDEDATLFEYMLDPQKKSYDINVVGVRALKLTSEQIQKFILPAIRRGVRYSSSQTDRLHRAARLPWKHSFAELKRIVLECNRYPKTNDAWVVGDTSVLMNIFYRYVRRGYAQYLSGQQTFLETYQIRDLESLPYWQPYGVEGPYPWRECLKTLEDHLAKHGTPPPLDIHKGGFVGLDATPFERLSGFLMRINQSDSKNELRLHPEIQQALDRVCGQYGLQWRKKRSPTTGMLIENSTTFITTSYNQFKQLFTNINRFPVFRQYLADHFPGYPEKHQRMESLERLKKAQVPPRHQPQRRREKAATTKGDGRRARRQTQHMGSMVMCRVCRRHINVSEYEKHIHNPDHLANKKKDFSIRASKSHAIEQK